MELFAAPLTYRDVPNRLAFLVPPGTSLSYGRRQSATSVGSRGRRRPLTCLVPIPPPSACRRCRVMDTWTCRTHLYIPPRLHPGPLLLFQITTPVPLSRISRLPPLALAATTQNGTEPRKVPYLISSIPTRRAGICIFLSMVLSCTTASFHSCSPSIVHIAPSHSSASVAASLHFYCHLLP